MQTLIKYEKIYSAEYKQPLNIRYNLVIMYKKTFILKETAKHFKLIIKNNINILSTDNYKTIKVFS